MKAAGFVMILTAALLFTLQRLEAERKKADTLRELSALLEQMEALLESEAPPMPELIGRLRLRARGGAEAFLSVLSLSLDRLGERSFSELWREALSACPALPEQARWELERLGAVLGRCTLETQAEALKTARRSLRSLAEQTHRELPEKRRLLLGLALAAALLGIVLI